jgi:hypothetical protein
MTFVFLVHYHLQEGAENVWTKRMTGLDDVLGQGNIPLFIANEGVKFAHTWVHLFGAPRELAVLKM